jgi:hypothetical protein
MIAMPVSDSTALEVVELRGYPATVIHANEQIQAEDATPVAHAWRSHQPVFLASRSQAASEHPEFGPGLSTRSANHSTSSS